MINNATDTTTSTAISIMKKAPAIRVDALTPVIMTMKANTTKTAASNFHDTMTPNRLDSSSAVIAPVAATTPASAMM